MTRFFIFCLVATLTAGCAATRPTAPLKADDPQAIVERQWQWVSTTTPEETITVERPQAYTLFLKSDRNAHARFDCNRGGGPFTLSAGKLSFGPMFSTKAACRPDSLDFRFARDLQRVVSFLIKGNHLYLVLPGSGGTMRFRPSKD